MKSYTHYTLSERECLYQMREEGKSFREIARALGRSASSVCREYNRNYSKKKKRYNPWRATVCYIIRRRRCVRKLIIQEGSELYQFIAECLQKFWSPEIIAHKCKEKGFQVSISTIYAAIRRGVFKSCGISPRSHLRRRGKHPCTNRKSHNTIQPERTIHERADVIEQKERFGDWEGDTICGAKNKSCLVTQVDRKSKLLAAAISPTHTKEDVRKAISRAFDLLEIPIPIHSITLDNGSEFADFKKIESDLHTEIYFADPHAPWQRGLNENTNDMLRFFFPKGTDFSKVSEAELLKVLSLINNRPRKTLDFLSPIEFLSKKCCT